MESSEFEDFIELKDLKNGIREKAIEIAQKLIKEKNLSKQEAIKEGINQAEEWFMDLEG